MEKICFVGNKMLGLTRPATRRKRNSNLWFLCANVWKFNYSASVFPSNNKLGKFSFLYFYCSLSESNIAIDHMLEFCLWNWFLSLSTVQFFRNARTMLDGWLTLSKSAQHLKSNQFRWSAIGLSEIIAHDLSNAQFTSFACSLAWFAQTIVRYKIGK